MYVLDALFLRTYTKYLGNPSLLVSIHSQQRYVLCYHWVNHHEIRVQKIASHGIAVEP